MANETEKFVLQYVTEIKDSVARLEQLQNKVKQTNEVTKKGTEEFKHFVGGAADEIGKLVPGIDSVTAATRNMNAQFAIAGVAIAAVAAGVKAVMVLRDQYGKQRDIAVQAGVGGNTVEDMTRKMIRMGGQSMTRDKASEAITHAQQLFRGSYLDVQRTGNESRILRMLGVDVGPLGKPKPFSEMMGQLGANMQQFSPERARGKLMAAGFDKDAADAIYKAGASMGRLTELTLEDVKARQKAEESLAKFNVELTKFDEAVNHLTISLGQKLLPTLTKVVEWIAEKVEGFEKNREKTEQAYTLTGGDKSRGYGPMTLDSFLSKKLDEGLKAKKEEENKGKSLNTTDKPIGVLTKEFEKNQAEAQRIVDQENDNAAQVTDAMNDLQLAVNMFSGAVATFSNAVDLNQAIAAWAGQIGKDVGISAPPSRTTGRANGATASFGDLEAYIDEASQKYPNVPKELIKKVIKGESGMNPNAVSSAGAQGLMQVMPANSRALGVTNPFDPKQNIDAGTRLLSDALKMSGGDINRALRIYQGGPNEKIWGKANAAYPEYILKQDVSANGLYGSVRGQSRESVQMQMVEQNIAARLGVPLSSLRSGNVNKGDIAFARQQLTAGYQNNIQQLNAQLMNPMLPPVEQARIRQEIMKSQQGLNLMTQYGAQAEMEGASGGRFITIGEIAIQVNTMAGDPEQVGREIGRGIVKEAGAVVNQNSSTVKY